MLRRAMWSAILTILVGCHSEESPGKSGRDEVRQAASAQTAELAKSYGLEIRPDVADGVPIRVVDAATRKPVADALVVSVDEFEFTYSENSDKTILCNARTLLKELGEAYATSSDGIARVARPMAPRSVFVFHGSDFGRTTLEVHDREEHVAPIAPRELMVEVVDKSGRPVSGVPIELAKCSTEPMCPGTTVGLTGNDGRLAIPALELERGVHRSCGRRDLIMVGSLVSGFELRPADATRLEPVRFTLPDVGEVDLEIQTPHPWPTIDGGRPWPHFSLLVSGTRSGEPRGLRRKSKTVFDRTLALPVESRRIRLERVEVGTILEARLRIQIDETTSAGENLEVIGADGVGKESFEGPAKAGGTRYVVLRSECLGGPVGIWRDDDAGDRSSQARRTDPKPAERATEEPVTDASSIEIALRLDVPIEPCWLRARLDSQFHLWESESCPWIDVNGHATMRGVAPGSHTVTITERSFGIEESEFPICSIEDVVLAPRELLRDRRLLDVDLRGKLRIHHLDVVDEEGHSLSGFVRLARENDPDYADQIAFENGRVDFLTAAGDGVHASLVVNRFRVADLDVTSSERVLDARGIPLRRRVVMKRGIPMRLALAPGFELPPEPHDPIYVGVSEMPHWDDSLDELRSVELRRGADLRFDLAEPGEWNVIFLRAENTGHDEPTVTECNAVETTITVADESQEQLITVTPDRDCWDRLVETLRRGE